MSIDEKLQKALTPIVPTVEPHISEDTALEYIGFLYNEYPRLHADGRPRARLFSLQVHWFLPLDENPNTKKRQIEAALMAAGCTAPSIVDASDEKGQHYIFECEAKEGRE